MRASLHTGQPALAPVDFPSAQALARTENHRTFRSDQPSSRVSTQRRRVCPERTQRCIRLRRTPRSNDQQPRQVGEGTAPDRRKVQASDLSSETTSWRSWKRTADSTRRTGP